MVRPPDLGIWLTHARGPDGTSVLVVTDILNDSPLASAGLREADRIVSVSGKPIDREQQLIQAFLTNPTVALVVTRGNELHTFTLKSSAVMDGMIPLDPYYQAGFLLDEHRPEATTVERVFPATLAFYAGLKPGDVIASLNDRPLESPAELTKALRRGGRLNLTVTRNGQPRHLTLLIPTPSIRLRSTTTAGTLSPGGGQPPFAPIYGIPSAPLLAPPSIPNPMPAIPSPPPAIPVLPPPGTVPSGT